MMQRIRDSRRGLGNQRVGQRSLELRLETAGVGVEIQGLGLIVFRVPFRAQGVGLKAGSELIQHV